MINLNLIFLLFTSVSSLFVTVFANAFENEKHIETLLENIVDSRLSQLILKHVDDIVMKRVDEIVEKRVVEMENRINSMVNKRVDDIVKNRVNKIAEEHVSRLVWEKLENLMQNKQHDFGSLHMETEPSHVLNGTKENTVSVKKEVFIYSFKIHINQISV